MLHATSVDVEDWYQLRMGGSLELAVSRLRRLVKARKRRGMNRPIIEVQFIDFDYNHDEIPEMRRLVRQWGADKLEVCAPDRVIPNARIDPRKPRRCFFLWSTLTVTWNLDYAACPNAWSLPWPRLNLRDVPSHEFWNHKLMLEARQFNIDKSSGMIANDTGCKCSRCVDMLAAGITGRYLCE